jgi:hypothetical protein
MTCQPWTKWAQRYSPVIGHINDCVNDCVALLNGKMVAVHAIDVVEMADDGFDVGTAAQLALDIRRHAALPSGGVNLESAGERGVVAASSGSSFVHETEGQLILNGSYDVAFTMDLALKDLGFAMTFGKEFGVPLDLASMTQQTFMKGKAAYGGSAQSTQIAKLLEDVLNTNLRAPGFPARLE